MNRNNANNKIHKAKIIYWMLNILTLPFFFILKIIVSNIEILYFVKLIYPLGLYLFHLNFYKIIKDKNVKKTTQNEIDEWEKQYIPFPIYPWLFCAITWGTWNDYSIKIIGNSFLLSFLICVFLLGIYF